MEEVWKPISNTYHLYWVSSLGRVRRSEYTLLTPNSGRWGSARIYRKERILKNILASAKSYHRVAIFFKLKTIHRLVAEAFIPNPQHKKQVNHIDGNKHNNSLNNLEWVTPSENAIHSVRTGLQTYAHTTGTRNKFAKLNEGKVFYIKTKLQSGINMSSLSKEFNVSLSTISDIKRGVTWKHVKV